MTDLNWLIPLGIGVISVLGTINAYILSGINKRLEKLESKLDQKQGKEDCVKARELCQKIVESREDRACDDMRDIWDAFRTHSHIGLSVESKVTR